ncbi:MAG TPA: hypothetical protein VLF21_02440 [Candidatus Saccharimonadales bacterium]|nr:hypothetical protein [Candidatus Saccharimonadales bacterium]
MRAQSPKSKAQSASLFKLSAISFQLQDQKGVIIIGAFIITFFFIIASLAVAEFGVQHYANTRRTLIAGSAINAAEAGAESFMHQINLSSTYQGTNNAPTTATNSCTGYTMSPVTLVNNSVQGKVTYETCVQNGTASNEKVVLATAKVYLPASATTPTLTRKVKLVINQSFLPAGTIYTGPGGLIMNNNVKLPTGPVYVGGKLAMSNGSSIGTTTAPTSVYVEDKACPIPATSAFPQICASGNSITTGTTANIYAATHATNNVDRAAAVHGSFDHTAPSITLPGANRATLTTGISSAGSAPSCSGTTVHLNGHYTGNFTAGPNCNVILDGNVWIDGNFTTGNNNTIKVGSSVTVPPNFIIDGSTGFTTGNNNQITANASGVAFNMYTFWSADTSCRPSCSSVTGTNLANSQGVTTINLSNNTTGMSNILFYAVWSKLVLGNNATVGQLIGQTIQLNNNGSVLFTASGATISGGWDVRYYEQFYK